MVDEELRRTRQELDNMFNGKLAALMKTKKQQSYAINDINDLVAAYKEETRRNVFAHSTIAKEAATTLQDCGWNVGLEIPAGDLDSNYRHDILAEKGAKKIIVEVKPIINVRELGQVLGYCHDAKKHHKKVRVFLATDLLNVPECFNGETRDIILEAAREHGLGLLFVGPEGSVWVLPGEYLSF